MNLTKLSPGQIYMGQLPRQSDLIASTEAFCKEKHIVNGLISVVGTVRQYVIGTYDPIQQVFVTASYQCPADIVICQGNVAFAADVLVVQLSGVFVDPDGNTIAGRIFAGTQISDGEITIMTCDGQRLEREYDPISGLMSWKRCNA